MYPSPFCNLSRRHWMGGGVRMGCGAGGTPTGRRVAPTAGGGRCRRSPRRTRKPPPASRALWETAQLGKRCRGTPRQIPGHFAPDPCPRAGAGWRPVPTELPSDTEPPAGHGTPRQPPGHFGRWPNWANAAGEPPARFRGTLRSPPALGPAPTAVGAGWRYSSARQGCMSI